MFDTGARKRMVRFAFAMPSEKSQNPGNRVTESHGPASSGQPGCLRGELTEGICNFFLEDSKMTKILSAIFAAVVLFSAAQAQAFSFPDLVLYTYNSTTEYYDVVGNLNEGSFGGTSQVSGADLSAYQIGFYGTAAGQQEVTLPPFLGGGTQIQATTNTVLYFGSTVANLTDADIDGAAGTRDLVNSLYGLMGDGDSYQQPRDNRFAGTLNNGHIEPGNMAGLFTTTIGSVGEANLQDIVDGTTEMFIYGLETTNMSEGLVKVGKVVFDGATGTFSIELEPSAEVPVPAALWLLGAGLGLVGLRRKA